LDIAERSLDKEVELNQENLIHAYIRVQ